MKTLAYLAGATALTAAMVAPAFAQTESTAGANAAGISQVSEQMDDIRDSVQDDFDRSGDAYRFGAPDMRQGLYGSVALTYAGRTGNNESQDFSLAGRLSFNRGQFSQSVGLLLEYGENDDGDKDVEKTSVIYEGMYNFNDRLYGFALGRLTTDGLAADPVALGNDETYSDLDGNLKRDAYFGVGPGYRILNSANAAWRVQAAIGVRYTKTVDVISVNELDDQDGTFVYASNTEAGYMLSSRFYYKFSDNFFLTNDTDYLTSDANDTITNDLGLNFKMSDAFATRVSYKTEYVSDRSIRTDNTLGVSLVYGF